MAGPPTDQRGLVASINELPYQGQTLTVARTIYTNYHLDDMPTTVRTMMRAALAAAVTETVDWNIDPTKPREPRHVQTDYWYAHQQRGEFNALVSIAETIANRRA